MTRGASKAIWSICYSKGAITPSDDKGIKGQQATTKDLYASLSGDQVDEGERMSLSEPWSRVNWYKRIRVEIPIGEFFQDKISDVNRDITAGQNPVFYALF